MRRARYSVRQKVRHLEDEIVRQKRRFPDYVASDVMKSADAALIQAITQDILDDYLDHAVVEADRTEAAGAET